MTGNTAWFPFYIGDYQADTMHLSCEQHGAYFLLMLAYYRRERALVDDNAFLAGIAKLTPRKWLEMRPVLAEFFKIEGGAWRHKRIDCEIAAQKARHDERRQAGGNGATARWQKQAKSKSDSVAQPIAQPIAQPSDSHSAENADDDGHPRPKTSRLTDQKSTKSTAKKCHTSQGSSLPLTGQRELPTRARDATPPLPSQGDGDAALRAVTNHKSERTAPTVFDDPELRAYGDAAFNRCLDAIKGKLGMLEADAMVPTPPDPALIAHRARMVRLNTLASERLSGDTRMQAWDAIARADACRHPNAIPPPLLDELDAIESLAAYAEAAE